MATEKTTVASPMKPIAFLALSGIAMIGFAFEGIRTLVAHLPSLPETTAAVPPVAGTLPGIDLFAGGPLLLLMGALLLLLLFVMATLLAVVIGFLLGRLSCAGGCGCGKHKETGDAKLPTPKYPHDVPNKEPGK